MTTYINTVKLAVITLIFSMVTLSCVAQTRVPAQNRSARQETTTPTTSQSDAKRVVTVDSVLNKYFEATGGKAKWDQIRNYSIKRKYTSTNVASYDAEISGVLADNALYKNEIIKGRGFIYGIKGNDAWRKVPLGSADKVTNYQVSDLSKDKAAEMRLELYDFLVPFLNYSQRGFVASLVGPDKYNGKDVQKVELQGKDARYTLLFDNDSGLLLQSRLIAGGEEIISDYSQYVKSDFGILYPSSITRNEVKRKANYKITSELTINKAVDSSLFSR